MREEGDGRDVHWQIMGIETKMPSEREKPNLGEDK
jgi:hypothetical protein